MKTPIKLKWDLEDIVNLDDFEKIYRETEARIREYGDFYRKMSPRMSSELFRDFIMFNEELSLSIHLLYWRAYLEEAADSRSQRARMLKNRAVDLDLAAGESSRKIWHWIKGKSQSAKKTLDPENAKRLFASCPEMGDRLNHVRDMAAHTLSEREEMIIENKDASGTGSLVELRTIIESELEFMFRPEGKKARKIRTQAELTRYVHSPDPVDRKAAYQALLTKYRENIDKFFCVYRSVAKDWKFESSLRGYTSPVQMRNRENRIPDAAVEALLAACDNNREIFHRYFRHKAASLGAARLSRFDLYAPVSFKERKIPFREALDTVLETFGSFSADFREKALKVIENKHIDSHPAPFKQGGAFCATPGPGTVPYVLTNYTGTTRDVLTLAHELGHAVHSLFSDHLPPSVQHAGLPLAETASTLGEMIVFERLYQQAKSESEKRSLLFRKIQESYATVLRQAYFVKFEVEAHERMGEGHTPESLSVMYFSHLEEQFGGSVELDEIFKYEWAYIPHIVHTPFYCYAYSFGELLSLSLYSAYRSQGSSFVSSVEKVLSSGGSRDPVEVLKEAGFDVTVPSFWENGFSVISEYQSMLEETGV